MLRNFLLICFLVIFFPAGAQQDNVVSDSKKAPLSIYTEGTPMNISDFYGDLPSNYLSLTEFKFRIVDQENIERNQFTIDFRNIGRSGSVYDYQTYRKAELNKYFSVIPDICVINRFNQDLRSLSH